MKTKSCLNYFGSDSAVAKELAAKLDGCRHVTIPFCGGLAILPHLTAKAVVCNDANSRAIGFYHALAGVYGEQARSRLIKRCRQTLSHPDEMRFAAEPATLFDSEERIVHEAWSYWAMCWIGRKGAGGTKNLGGNPSVRWNANGGNNATRLRAVAYDLDEWAGHFGRCEFTDMDFREVLSRVSDSPECGIYCDAPWVGAGDAYAHKFNEQDHRDLAAALSLFEKTRVVVRYGDSPLIRELYQGWTIEGAESRAQSGKDVDEVWITK